MEHGDVWLLAAHEPLSSVGALRVHVVYRRLLLMKPTATFNIYKELQRGIHIKQLVKD